MDDNNDAQVEEKLSGSSGSDSESLSDTSQDCDCDSDDIEEQDSEENDSSRGGLHPKVRKLSWTACLCCSLATRSWRKESFTPFTDKSWPKLHHAAAIRRDQTYVFLLREGTTSVGGVLCCPREFTIGRAIHHTPVN